MSDPWALLGRAQGCCDALNSELRRPAPDLGRAIEITTTLRGTLAELEQHQQHTRRLVAAGRRMRDAT